MSLYSASNLVESPVWTVVTNQQVTTNGIISVTIPMANPSSFYRLQWP
jgi:hypothetical protein